MPGFDDVDLRCDDTIDGVSVLWLFTYPDTDSLRAFQESRVDDGRGGLRMSPEACVSGRPGVREWDYGVVACWVPEGAARSVLHWTDERTDSYGVIRPRAGAERRLRDLWEAVEGLLVEAPDAESGTDG